MTAVQIDVTNGMTGRWDERGWRVRSIRVVLMGLGTAILLYGVYRISVDPNSPTVPVLKWLIGGDLVHDLILSPVVFLVGLGVKQVPDRLVRRWLAGTLMVMATLVLAAYPVLIHKGRNDDNGTVVPQNYEHNIVVVEVVTLVVALLFLAGLLVRRRQHPPHPEPHERREAAARRVAAVRRPQRRPVPRAHPSP